MAVASNTNHKYKKLLAGHKVELNVRFSAMPAGPTTNLLVATFFVTPAEFRDWLQPHAADTSELIVGFHKKGTGKPSMLWAEAVDEALCVGWIDGVRKRIDDASYQIRFTPRKLTSTWSAINIARVAELTTQGRMRPAGQVAFSHREDAKSRTYAYEQKTIAALVPADEARFRKSKKAWAFFEAQPPGYRKTVIWQIVSAKQEVTRQKRLTLLIEASKNGLRL